jgi:hypothetical protein
VPPEGETSTAFSTRLSSACHALLAGAGGGASVGAFEEADSPLLRQCAPRADPLVHELLEIDPSLGHSSGVGACERQERIHETGEPLDLRERSSELALTRRRHVAREVLEPETERCERRSQLMRRVRHELVLRAQQLLEPRGHVVERRRQGAHLGLALVLRRTGREIAGAERRGGLL